LSRFDAIVIGGSVGGLSFAGEAAKRGLSVLVLEEHDEIGEPEKCDGLVSLRGLRRYGLAPSRGAIQSSVREGVIHPPAGPQLCVDAGALEVVVIDRSQYDKQLAENASVSGARIKTGLRVQHAAEKGEVVTVHADQAYECDYLIDATGPASAPVSGIIPAAKYEVEAEWVEEGRVEVFIDQARYPGFFAWIIPYGVRRAKVGAAGRGINPFRALDALLESRPYRVIRRVAAPIYVGGPAERFVSGRKVWVGESAGQVKPTTAGGIATSIGGGVIAAKWVAESVHSRDPSRLEGYETEWRETFEKEMKAMTRLRGVFERLSNREVDLLVSTLSSPKLLASLGKLDFDFHATAFLSALGVVGLFTLARLVASAEVRQLLSGVRRQNSKPRALG